MKKLYAKIKIAMLTILLSMFFSSNIFAGVIVSQPRNVTECEGPATVAYTISVNTKSYTNITYQWWYLPYKTKIWKEVPSELGGRTETTQKLIMNFDKFNELTTELNRAQFRCVVKATYLIFSKIEETSASAYLYVNTPPTISSNPNGATKNAGESVTFSVYASSTITKYYKWQKNGVDIPGATASSYTISNLSVGDAGTYRCLVSNNCGSKYSSGAVLVVNEVEYDDGWFEQTSPTSQDIRKVDAVDRYNAWAVTGDTDRLLKTSDGGETWTSKVTGRNYSYWQCIEMITSTNIFIGGSNVIGKTTDGGTVWNYYDVYTELELGESIYIYAIQFPSVTTGFAVGRGGLIMKTTDGGTTWTKQNWKNDATPITDVDLRGLFFLDINNGYAVGDNGVILKTTNGGDSWTKLPSFNSTALNSVFFLNANTGFATGRGSYRHLLKTTDGGTTWATLSNDLPNCYPYDVQFIDANNGYVGGQVYNYTTSSYEGAVLKTNDAGQSWHIQKVIGANQLYDMIMIDEEDGWAVGDAGEIQRTATGGCYTPRVNLFEDIAFCGSESHTMVADSFESNLNCTYLWNTGSTAGQLTANTTNTYSVTVTNRCNITATDEININVFDLPTVEASDDVAICNGDSTQLNASGANTYIWSMPAYLDDENIQNPLAAPPAGLATKFTVTGTDANGCVNTDDVYVTVNHIPNAVIDAPAFVCGNQTATIKHIGTSGIENFNWAFEDSLTSTGTTTGSTTVNWDAANIGMKTISLVVDKLGCTSDTATQQLEVRVIPTAAFTAPEAVCSDEAAEMNYTGTAPVDATYNWTATGGNLTGSGQGPVSVTYDSQGTKTVGLEVVQAECSSGTNQMEVIASYPYQDEEICLVTVDLETGKNMVIWEKTPDVGIAEYRIYTESTVGGVYNIIGSVPFDSLTVFIDETSEPEKKQNLYKIKVVDTCGYESDYSPYHKTMHLQYVNSNNGVNLSWEEYKVEGGLINFDSYIIYRGSDSTALEELETVSSSINSYTDTDVDALSQRMYYRVGGVKANACDPAGLLAKKAGSGPFVHSLSNLEDNRLTAVSVSDHLAQSLNLKLYPNPFNTQTVVSYNLKKDSQVKIEVYNIIGEKIYVLENNKQTAGDHKFEINASDLNNHEGLYYIRLFIDDESIIKKVILRK